MTVHRRHLVLGAVVVGACLGAYLVGYLSQDATLHAARETAACEGTLIGVGAPEVGGVGQSGICAFQSPARITLHLSWAGPGAPPTKATAWLHLEGSENAWLEAASGWTLQPPRGELDATVEPDAPGVWHYTLD